MMLVDEENDQNTENRDRIKMSRLYYECDCNWMHAYFDMWQ